MADNHLVDPSLGRSSPDLSSMGLSAQEQAALKKHIDPSQVLGEHQQQHASEQSAIERYEYERVLKENQALQAKLESNSSTLNDMQNNYAQMSGKLDAMERARQDALQNQQLDAQYALTQEDLDNHGEAVPVIQKLIKRNEAALRKEYEERLAAELAAVKDQATAPVREELAELKRQTEEQQTRAKENFATEVNSYINALGYSSINELVQNPEFLRQHAAPLYPGAVQTWGDELTSHMNNMNLGTTQAMLKAFKDSITTDEQREDLEVPAGNLPKNSTPVSSSQQANLDKRKALLQVYQRRMQDANRGVFPQGMNRSQYMTAQTKILDEIDKIPTT